MKKSNLLIVDLNNFAAYPTLAVGYLIRSLKNADYDVELLSPLAIGAPAYTRDEEETWKDQLQRRLYFSTHPILNYVQDWLRDKKSEIKAKPHKKMRVELRHAINKKPDAILVSAYLSQYEMCKIIGEMAKKSNIPVLLGGPFFNLPKVVKGGKHYKALMQSLVQKLIIAYLKLLMICSQTVICRTIQAYLRVRKVQKR